MTIPPRERGRFACLVRIGDLLTVPTGPGSLVAGLVAILLLNLLILGFLGVLWTIVTIASFVASLLSTG